MAFTDVPAPAAVVNTLAVLGALVLGAKVFSYVRLLFSLFVLPGVSVSFLAYVYLKPAQILTGS